MNVKKWHKYEICIVINDKSQGSIAKHLRCDEILYYTFIDLEHGDFWNIDMSQGSVATQLRCGGKFK